jgi:hypothetical protein
MAGISFEEAAGVQPTTTTPSKGISFEEAAGVKPAVPTTSGLATFAREAGLNVPATMAGIGAGELVAGTVTPLAGPIAGAVSGLVAGGAVGFGVNYLGESGLNALENMDPLAQRFMQLVGVDRATREAGRKEYEYSALAGQLASGGPFMSTAAKNIGQRVVGGGINVGVGAGSRAAFGEEQDFKKSAMEFAAGAAMPGTLSKTGERIPGVRKTEPVTTEVKKPTTPEEQAKFIKDVEAKKAERDSKAPLVEAAIRNKETGEIERMGPKHDQARKEATKDTHEEGFIDERGNFHERQAAVDQAKRAGQIPEDHVLESPPGERPGLHSGDLRKVGDERFAVTEDRPAGKAIENKDYHRERINSLEMNKIEAAGDLEYAKLDNDQSEIDRLQTTIDKMDAEIAKQKSMMDSAPLGRSDYKGSIKEIDFDLNTGIPVDIKRATNKGDLEAVKQLQEKQQQLELQRQDLIDSMPPVKFENPTKPTPYELQDHLYGAKSVGEAFDRILKTEGLGTKGQRALLVVLNKSQFIRDANLQFKDNLKYIDSKDGQEKYAAGMYTGGTQHLVELTKSEGDIRVLAHEAMHAGTQRLLEEGTSPAAIKLKQLYEQYKSEHPARYEEAVKEFQKIENPTIKQLKEFQKRWEDPYGLENVHEFVAEAFTNKDFQYLLGSVEVESKPGVLSNLWQSFKNIVREGLQIPTEQRTAFDEVIEQGVALVEESKSFKREGDVTPLPSEPTSSSDELAEKTSEPVAEEFKKVDPRSIPNEEAMIEHATDIYERYGEKDAIQFFEDYKKDLNERSIPVPNDAQGLDDFLHKLGTYTTKDRSEHVVGYKENTDKGVTEQQRAQWFNMRENGIELPPEGKAVLDAIDAENIALVRKAKGMGLEVGEEFTSGQSRIRLFSEKEKPGWKESIKKFFSNDTPMGDKIANEADAAIERKVFQTDDGRVIELHRQPEDTQIKMPDGKMRQIKKGTEIWEWKDGKKQLIGHSDNLQLKRGDKFDTKRFSEKLSEGPEVGTASERRKFKMEPTIVDGKVPEIERHSPYRYLHDAEASARIANMGLRKMVREAEAIENLKKSELFKQVGHSPEQDLKDLPKGWKQPENIDRIPQLRGWAFDPKTRVIIEDFAKVWDNSMYMKLSNAIVKNMMLNPIPHMFNEVMHLWNARGFSGWVMPSRLGTFADTARVAWRDVGNQTQFYRDIMREGGSVLGADPRNKGYFDVIQKEASKQMFGTPEMERNMKGLAKKLGVPVANLYNGISEASQKAMWFTRDVMYVQLVREIMARQEKSGNKMTLKEAIDQAERHMPNYRLPSEVAGSRAVSQVLRDPRISMFSRYHYGMVKSLVNTLKDVDPRNLKTAEGREHFREGVDSMIAIGVALSVLYPLMDSVAEAMFGEGAEQRRAGPFHLLHAGMDVVTGKKDASALIWPIFTFNPVALTVGQLAFNKKIFTGKEIYHPDDSLADIMGDVTGYAAGQIPQVPPILSATAEEEGATKLLARQLDIKSKTSEQIAREERAKKRQERVKKGRDTKREKGTYRP